MNTTNVETHGGIELQGLAAGGGFGIAEEHADLLTQLVDEDGGGAGLSQRAGHLAQRLTHESGLQTNMAVSHFAFDFGLRHQSGDRVDDDDVKRTGANQHVSDFEGLLAVIRLGDDE